MTIKIDMLDQPSGSARGVATLLLMVNGRQKGGGQRHPS